MKCLAVVLLLLCCVCAPVIAQENQDKPAKKKANAEARQKAKDWEAQIRTELAERAAIYDLQYDDAQNGFKLTTFELSTIKGMYRLENKKDKLLIQGSGSIEFKGCWISLTDVGSLVATINICRSSVEVYVFSNKRAYDFYEPSTDEDEESADEDLEVDDGPPPASEWCR